MELEKIKNLIGGELFVDDSGLAQTSRDASIFEVKPNAVVKPRDIEDLKKLVKLVAENKSDNPELSLTARAAGTDMSGGPLNDSIIVDFANFNKIIEVGDGYAITEPGVYYRDFEKATLERGWLLPSYPASREICTVGGMVANNAGGEKSLAYGKTDKHIEELQIVLSDGEGYIFRPLNPEELEQKKSQDSFESSLYARMHKLIEMNYELVQAARPKVSKNSAGYALWDVWNREIFDLTKLFCGSQGTLGLITRIKFKLIKPKPASTLLVIFLKDFKTLAEIIKAVTVYQPESFESFDKHTVELAVRFLPGLIKNMKGNFLSFAFKFLPELWMVLTGGIPSLVLLAEFTGDNEEQASIKAQAAKQEVESKFDAKTRVAVGRADAQKYWTMRRESFNLLRQHVSGKKAVPFIDDVIVLPEKLPEFLPRLNAILIPYEKQMTYTIAGHVGDGNFHIIPLMDLSHSASRLTIQEVAEKVYDLVIEFDGSITAEHNDGLIRTPYLEKMYGSEMVRLFEETKKIFDPQNIFNPRKKVGGEIKWAMEHLKKN